MMPSSSEDRVAGVEVHVVDLSQDTPYLGALREGEVVNEAGYFVRKGNRTVYPTKNRSLVVRVWTEDGVEGWGETYGLVAPKAPAAIINDLLAGFVIGRDPFEVEGLHDELYDLMRVRGYTGGFYLDALAAVDIALWDIAGKIAGKSVAALLGGSGGGEIPAYVSGLPEESLEKRCDLAVEWQGQGYDSFKFALPAADEGAVRELSALRGALGEEARIAADLHWAFSPEDAVAVGREMARDEPWFLEAPVATEDVEGLKRVAEESGQVIAAGEEWRTLWDARARVDRGACQIVQPEMGHTGVTEFMRMGGHAKERGLEVIPHATIGSGIFLAASLQASVALGVEAHEFQHSLFGAFRHFTGEVLACEAGVYRVADAPGIGVEPSAAMREAMTLIEP